MTPNLLKMRFAKSILFLLVLTYQPLLAQDWKTPYEQSKQAYEAGQYEQALTSGQKAYDQARTVDAKAEAYTLQLLTVICLDGGFPDKGLLCSEEDVKKFLALEGENSLHRYEALRKQAKFLQQSGQLSVAAEKNIILNELAKKIYGTESYEYYTSCFSYGQLLMELGSFSLSQEVWNKCLQKLKQFPEGSDDYFYGLYYAAYVDNKVGATQNAIGKWTEFISIADQNNLRDLDEYKQAKMFLAGSQNKVPSGTRPDDQSLQQHLTTALAYQNKKQWDLAAQEYTLLEKTISAETTFSNTAFSHYLNYGRLLFQQRKFSDAYLKVIEAKKIAEKLFEPHAPEHGHIQYLEAELKLAEGKVAEAQQLYINAFANLTSATPEIQTTYLINASHAMLGVDQPHYSLVLMQPYAKSGGVAGVNDKHRMDFSITYCDVLAQLNRNDDVVNYLNEVIALSPPPAKIVLQTKLAEALKESGRWQEAINLLQLILRSSSLSIETKAEASYQLARVQQQLGQHVASEKNYLAALDLYTQVHSDDIWEVSNSLGTFYTELGNYEAAENIYRDALKSYTGGLHL
jgi:tetratricopeptide (TPR) repeat protein